MEKDGVEAKKSETALKEEAVLKFWKENAIFEKSLTKDSPAGEFVFFEGPPTANAKPALHHLEARAFKDVIPRYKTMQGFHVRRQGGWDTHGLPVELQIEKKLGLNSKKAIEEYGIEKFNKECKDSVFEYIKDWEDFTDRIGYWVDKKNAYFTFNNSYIESLWNVLAHVEKRGLLYKDYRIVPWCSRCGTSLATHELAQGYEDVKDLSVVVKFKIKPGQALGDWVTDDNTFILAWTTTPWTLPGNVALATGVSIKYTAVKNFAGWDKEGKGKYEWIIASVDAIKKERANPGLSIFADAFLWKDVPNGFDVPISYADVAAIEDRPKYFEGKDLENLEYEPVFSDLKNYLEAKDSEPFSGQLNRGWKVYNAGFVNTDDGTGVVHIAPMYGQDDFELATKQKLPKYHTVDEQGKFRDVKEFNGRFVKEEIEKKPVLAIDIIKYLQDNNFYFSKKYIEHTYPHCWRCKTPLIYYARDSWYIGMESLRDDLVRENQKINWEPGHIKEGRFGEWVRNIKDWAISRERYWGTPLPIWMAEDGDRIVVDSVETLRKYSNKKLTKIIFVRHGEAEHNVKLMSSSARDKNPLTEKGLKQVKKSAEIIGDQKVDVVYVSPILRARQTAEAYLSKHKHKIILDDRIAEIQSGNWEDKSQFDPAIKASRDAYKALSVDERFVTKRGETGESWADLEARVKDFLDEVLTKHAGKTILCFAHQGTDEIAVKLLKGMSNKDAAQDLFHSIENGDVMSLYINDETKKEFDLHRPFIDNVVLERDGKTYTRVKEVMDVWFDSGAMPFAQDHYPFENKEWIDGGFLKKGKGYPADFISEAIDQTRGWFYTLLAVGVLMGKGTSYKNCICLGHILDDKGKKMSKSIGNIVNPWEMMDKYGVDTLRLWMYSVNQPGDSKNFDEKTVAELHGKIFTLISNCYKFFETYAPEMKTGFEPKKSQNVLDAWILARLAELVKEGTEKFDAYKVFEPARALRDFVSDLSTWYIRRSRDRFKGDDEEDKQFALATTKHIFTELAKFMAPMTPFFAEDLYQKVGGEKESVHLESWPETGRVDKKVLESMKITRELVSMGLEARQKANIKVRQPLSTLTIHQKLDAEYSELLKDEVNVKEIISGSEIALDTNITDELKREGDFREFLRSVQGMRKDNNLSPTDLVRLSIPETSREIISGFEEELKKVAGIKEIKWGGEVVRIEK